MSRACLSWGLALGLGLVGCESQRALSDFPVTFVSKTDEGELLPKVNLTVKGQLLGSTNQQGRLKVLMKGLDGDVVPYDVACPNGYTKIGPVRPFIMRQLTSLQGNSEAEVEVRCKADRRVAALLVNTPNFPNLPVLVHGQEVGRTDTHGIAHVYVEGSSNTPLRVTLDTGARPYVVPVSPHKDIRIGDRDEIFVFAPELSEVLPPKPKAKHKPKEKPPEPEQEPEIIRPERL